MSHRALKASVAAVAGRVTWRVIVFSRPLPAPLYHCLAPADGAPSWVTTSFFGSTTTTAWGSLLLYSSGPSVIARLPPTPGPATRVS